MGIRRLWVAALATALVVTGGDRPAQADAVHLVAEWSMDEGPGARVMHDSSGNRLDGMIGREVLPGARVADGQGYRFTRLQPDTPPAHPRHLVVVPDDPRLDPGRRPFEVTLRLRTTDQFGNIIQKGQATVAGGSWKLQIPAGKVQCWFRGSAGQVLVTAPRAINDGRWHVVRCTRFDDGVALAIDGTRVAAKLGATGTIANSWPLSLGGKTTCDQVEVGCDYFAGDIDWVRLDASF